MEKYKFLRLEMNKTLEDYLLGNKTSQSLSKKDISFLNYQLLKICRSFSTSDFEKSNIYTAPFFYDVIIPMYPNSRKNYSVMFLDFNNLGKINSKYGHEQGDFLLGNSLSAIEDSLPEGSIFVRKGGDEFVIISDTTSKNDFSVLSKTLSKQLHALSKENLALTATFAHRSSSDYDSQDFKKEPDSNSKFFKMLSDCEAEVSAQKLKKEFPFNASPETVLKNKIQSNVSKIFSISRFDPSTKFDITHLRIYLNHLASSIYRLVSTPELIQHKEEDEFSKNPTFSNKDASDLFEIIKPSAAGNVPLLRKLQKFDTDKLKDLTNILTTNPNSNLRNRIFSETLLAPHINSSADSYVVSTFLLSGLKSSNFVNGYNLTDSYLKQISEKLEALTGFDSSTSLDFRKSPSHLIDYGGGQYIYVSNLNNPVNKNLNSQALAEKLDTFANSLDSNFNVISVSDSISGRSKNFNTTVDSLLKQSEKKKSQLKLQSLERYANSESQNSFFDSVISDSISYYLNPENGFIQKDVNGKPIFNLDSIKSNLLTTFLSSTKSELEKFEHFRKNSGLPLDKKTRKSPKIESNTSIKSDKKVSRTGPKTGKITFDLDDGNNSHDL